MRVSVITWAAVIIVFQSSLSGCLVPPYSAPYTMEERLLTAEETSDEAIAALRRLIKEDSQNPEPRRRIAEIFLKRGELEKARLAVNQAINLNPLSAEQRLLAGRIYYRSANYFKAVNQLSGALKLNNRLLSAYYFLALSHGKIGKIDRAASLLESALKLEPLFFDARLELISIQAELNPKPANFRFLTDKLKDVLKIHPASTKGALLLSKLYERLGETYKSTAVLESRLKKHGDDDRILSALARIKYQVGLLREADRILRRQKQPDIKSRILNLKIQSLLHSPKLVMSDVEQLLAERPSSEEALLLFGELKLRRGKIGQAELAIQKVLTINPDNAEAYYYLAKIHKSQNDPAGSRWALAKAFRADPENRPAVIEYLKQLAEDGDWKTADGIISRLGLASENPEIIFIKGLIAAEQENYGQAEELFLKVAREKYSPRVEAQLSNIEIIRGKLDQARKRLGRADRLFPDNLEIALSKALWFFKTKKTGEIPSLLRPFLKRPDGLGRVHILLAESLAGSGQIKEAIRILSRASKKWPENQGVVQAHTFYLGLDKQYEKATNILEKLRPFKSREYLFKQRLKRFYFMSGKMKNFKNSPLF